MILVCPHCGAENHTSVYSDCYRCNKKLPRGGSIRPPEGMQANGRTVLPESDRLAR